MSGTLTFDHVLIAVNDLRAARADFESLGFTVFYGGKHADGRTENCLIVFQNGGYLELIALTDPDDVLEPGGMHAGLFEPGEGFAGFALSSSDLGADTAAMRGRDLDLMGPIENSRVRPDGEKVAWVAAVMTGSPIPFFIEDLTSRELRVPSGHAEHPNGATGVSRLVVAVANLEEATDRYARIFGSEPFSSSLRLEASTAVDFTRGSTTITLAEPDGKDSPLQIQLTARGDSPYAVVLATSGATGALNSASTHGARITLEQTRNN